MLGGCRGLQDFGKAIDMNEYSDEPNEKRSEDSDGANQGLIPVLAGYSLWLYRA